MESTLESQPKWYEGKKGLLFALGLSAGIKFSLALSAGDINPDGDDYIWAAQLISKGDYQGALDLTSTPFFSLLLALVHVVIPHWVVAARILSSASLVFAVIPLYLLARDLFGARSAFFACCAFALAPYFNECAMEVIRGPVYLFAFSWGAYFAKRAFEEENLFLLTAALISVWASVFLRLEAILLVAFVPLFWIGLIFFKSENRTHILKSLFLWLGLPACVLLIFMVSTHSQAIVFERAEEVTEKVEDFLNLKFLENYSMIYEQLDEMEELSPYPGGKQNLAEIARHFMPGLYLYGLLRTLIDVLFPFFFIPLIWGFRHRLDKGRVFVILLTALYLLLILYHLVDRDFIQGRFLLVPAFLLYPWVGLGMEKIRAFVSRPSMPWWPLVLSALLFLAAPAAKSAELYWEGESITKKAGKWLSSQQELRGKGVVSTDSRIVFYAGMGPDFTHFSVQEHERGYEDMEKTAIQKNAHLLLLDLSLKDRDSIPVFKHFERIKAICGKEDFVLIYRRISSDS